MPSESQGRAGYPLPCLGRQLGRYLSPTQPYTDSIPTGVPEDPERETDFLPLPTSRPYVIGAIIIPILYRRPN